MVCSPYTFMVCFTSEPEQCPKCKNWFSTSDKKTAAITSMHMKLCEGDAVVTLMKVEQQYKEWFCR